MTRVWLGVLLPPVAWVADFMARYMVIRWANIHDRRWPMALCTGAALALLLVGAWLCWRVRRAPAAPETPDPGARRHLAAWGLGLAAYFFVLILVQAYPTLLLSPREIT